MYCGTETLRSNIDVYDHTLRFSSQTSVSVSHRKSNHLVRASDDAGESIAVFILSFDNCLQ